MPVRLFTEYGGGDYTVSEGTVYFSNFADQRLYRVTPDSTPEPMTPVAELRYADAVVDRQRERLICVCEDHTQAEREAVNMLVSLPLDANSHEGMRVLVSGNDFYSSPRLSPDGSRLAWLTWNHPNMPWDGTELWVGELAADGSVSGAQCVAGNRTESIFQPEWSPDGVLHFISDRTGWWNIYRRHNGLIEPLCEKSAEFGLPQWVFGLSTYAFVSPQCIICSYTGRGAGSIASLDTTTSELTPIETPYANFTYIRASAERVVFYAASPTLAGSLVQLDLATNKSEVLRRSSNVKVDAAYLSVPQLIEFPTEQGRTAYAFFYPPRNSDYNGPSTELPPLMVESHGGPTSATTSSFNLSIQFWTSRGFAFLDVNYGGSTGYGREYRDRLKGQWGVVDVDDCVNCARYLVERGLVDGKRLAIRGGSAGGYTTLSALAFRNVFHAGASYFGVSDIEGLAQDTHKFRVTL